MVNIVTFTSSGTWTCPLLVTGAVLIGFGGGGGGGCAMDDFLASGGGGGASLQQCSFAQVIPLANYNVTIGAGGAGGFVGSQDEHCGQDGYPTIFATNGGIVLASFLGGGGAGVLQAGGFNHGGAPWARAGGYSSVENLFSTFNAPGGGGGWIGYLTCEDGMLNLNGGFSPGIANYDITTYGAPGGGAGPRGRGGDGGTAASPDGESAPANSGGGGGGGNTGSTQGGNGGSGFLAIIY